MFACSRGLHCNIVSIEILLYISGNWSLHPFFLKSKNTLAPLTLRQPPFNENNTSNPNPLSLPCHITIQPKSQSNPQSIKLLIVILLEHSLRQQSRPRHCPFCQNRPHSLREGYIVFPDLHVFYKETRDNWFSFVYLSV